MALLAWRTFLKKLHFIRSVLPGSGVLIHNARLAKERTCQKPLQIIYTICPQYTFIKETIVHFMTNYCKNK